MFNKIKNFVKNEEGQSLTEYIILAVLIALVVFGAVTALGRTSKGKFKQIDSKVNEQVIE